uniref:Secreted protein n=1 Tax=Steinernema glaseri TaxID=37863 RepID=A0A1I8AU31_9BILA
MITLLYLLRGHSSPSSKSALHTESASLDASEASLARHIQFAFFHRSHAKKRPVDLQGARDVRRLFSPGRLFDFRGLKVSIQSADGPFHEL